VNAISRKEILAKIPPLDGIRPAESGGEGGRVDASFRR